MINLLAIETSGPICSVCLELDGNRFSVREHVARGHNERLLPMLADIRSRAGLSEPDFRTVLDAVAFGCGPGSFTGVRIAAAAAQAIALASDVPIMRVPSSEALALKASSLAQAPGVVTLIRSRRELYYLAVYQHEREGLSSQQGDVLHEASPAPGWYRAVRGYTVIGERPDWWRGQAVIGEAADAEQVLEVGLAMSARGQGVDASGGLPTYLGGDSPWRKST
jgi:tRNA threonylcarbamoyladenosine biosynthesis protein TsaB